MPDNMHPLFKGLFDSIISVQGSGKVPIKKKTPKKTLKIENIDLTVKAVSRAFDLTNNPKLLQEK